MLAGEKLYFTLNKQQSIHLKAPVASKHQELCVVDESIISHFKVKTVTSWKIAVTATNMVPDKIEFPGSIV